MKTSNNHVLITGGSSGIGFALAKKFLEEDNQITITGRNENTLVSAQKKLPGIEIIKSGLALVPKEAAPVYCASKSGMHILTKSFRWQLEKTDVRIFEVLPSLVDTPMTTGRGKGKIAPERLVEEFWKGFKNDRYEIMIEKVKLLHMINRVFPWIAEKVMRKRL